MVRCLLRDEIQKVAAGKTLPLRNESNTGLRIPTQNPLGPSGTVIPEKGALLSAEFIEVWAKLIDEIGHFRR